MKKIATLFLATMFLSSIGCAKKVSKYWDAAGGSRSDATIVVGYTYNPHLEIPQVDNSQAHKQALERCRAWGYQEAEAFGLITKRCQDPQCLEILVTQQFQCLGRGDMTTPLEQEAINGKRIKP